MRRAILLAGFNNWGKTTHICSLFDRHRFSYGRTYRITDVNASFTVESHSNDDFAEQKFVNTLTRRIDASPDKGKNIFCALCPCREDRNDSRRILTGNPFSRFDEIHILLLAYKWDCHAELRIEDIDKYLGSIPNLKFVTIDADPTSYSDAHSQSKIDMQIVAYLQKIYL